MATVRTDAYQLPLPAGWSDRTAVTIVAPAAADGSVPNLVITREALCDGMGLAGFADGHANLMRDQVDAYELLSNGWEALDGERALVRIVRFQRRRLGAARAAAGVLRARRPRLRDLRHGHRGGVRGGRARVPRGARRPALRRARRSRRRTRSRCCAGERAQPVRRSPGDRHRARALRPRAARDRRRRLPGAAPSRGGRRRPRLGPAVAELHGHRAPGRRDRARR